MNNITKLTGYRAGRNNFPSKLLLCSVFHNRITVEAPVDRCDHMETTLAIVAIIWKP